MKLIALAIPDNFEIHAKNYGKLAAVDGNVVAMLFGEMSNVNMNDIAQYYSFYGSCHGNDSNLVIVLPTDVGMFLKRHPEIKEVVEFSNEDFWKSYQIECTRLQLSIPKDLDESIERSENHVNEFANAYIGGTFDRVHYGHKLMFTQLALISKGSCTIAVANGDLIKNKKFKEMLQSFDERCRICKETMNMIRPDIETKTCELLDPFGPPISDETVDALVVSLETIKGGDKINETRRAKGWKEIYISCIPLVQFKGTKEKVSSTDIRERDAKLQL